jgi:superoxide reductase
MEQKFLICEHCGNIVSVVNESGVPMMCCGQKMKQIEAGVVEASREKHIPVFEVKGNVVEVNVGSIDHPMIPEHYIEWVSLQTKAGTQLKRLEPNQAPKVCFALCDGDEVEAVYAYCNLHGLWVKR